MDSATTATNLSLGSLSEDINLPKFDPKIYYSSYYDISKICVSKLFDLASTE